MFTNIILLLFFILFIVFFKTLFRSYYNPFSLFASVWLISVLGTIVFPINFTEISLKTTIFVIFVFLAMTAGALIPKFVRSIRHRESNFMTKGMQIKNDVRGLQIKNRRIFQAICALSFLGLLAPILMVLYLYKTGYISLLTDFGQHSQLREMSLSGGRINYSLLVDLLPVFDFTALVFAGYYFAVTKKRSRYIFLWPFVNILLVALVNAGRAMLIWGSILFMSSFIYSKICFLRQKIKITVKQVSVLFFAMALMMLMRIWRGGSFEGVYVFTKNYFAASVKWDIDSQLYYSLINLLSTISGPIPALSHFFENSHSELSFGNYTFLPFFKYLLNKDVSFYYQPVPIPFDFNVFTYLRELYSDFGFWGMMVANMALGFLVSELYFRCRERFGLINLFILSFLSTFLIYSIWLPISYATTFWFSLFAAILISFVVNCRKTFHLNLINNYGKKN